MSEIGIGGILCGWRDGFRCATTYCASRWCLAGARRFPFLEKGNVGTVFSRQKCGFIEGMKERIDRQKDGSIKAKGHMMDGELEGYWEWFRLDGSKLRSGHFKSGKQVGEWTTYDATGKVVKVTNFPK